MVLTYPDSGVLFTGWRGTGNDAAAATRLLSDPDCAFVASPFLRLETLPKAAFRRNAAEVLYYELFFSLVVEWASVDDALVEHAVELGRRYDVTNLDALHAAAAIRVRADRFVTTGRPGRPLYRVTEVEVVPLTAWRGA